jgi:hypothetical protein
VPQAAVVDRAVVQVGVEEAAGRIDGARLVEAQDRVDVVDKKAAGGELGLLLHRRRNA